MRRPASILGHILGEAAVYELAGALLGTAATLALLRVAYERWSWAR